MSCTNVGIYTEDPSLELNVGLVKSEGKNVVSISRDSDAPSNGHSCSSVVDQGHPPMDEPCSTSPICAAPLCRQFWKAGNYIGDRGSKATFQSNKNYLHVHPKFLHSNATSHKWIFGAIAELIDNAIDEIQNGASFVVVDKVNNPRDEKPALLIQDDGAGMDPEAMRRCMSFGFSDKKSNSAIGQYGNGFKTSSMRLGADVIVFSRHLNNGTLTQSIGLLSYTFLTQAGYDKIVVPMVDYEFSTSSNQLEPFLLYGREHFNSNLSLLLEWSPYSTEIELLSQFNDIGYHGTKIMTYNLWCSSEGIEELDFDFDPEDICVSGETKKFKTTARTEQHMANRLHFSLRVYLSILYLRVPEQFRMVLRGKVVQLHNIADDLKFPQFILYKPQSGGCVEGQFVTTIGFLKEAPHVNVHGFNVYHKNRLIMPFWQVLRSASSRGRGVAGVLEANFIEPTHNKQDFERTSLFQKLEVRLKDMTVEYWDYHCHLIGYHSSKNPRIPGPAHGQPHSKYQSIQKPTLNHVSSVATRAEQLSTSSKNSSHEAVQLKRKACDPFVELQTVKKQSVTGFGELDSRHWEIEPVDAAATRINDREVLVMMEQNKSLHAQCLQHEREVEEYNGKVGELRSELELVRSHRARLVADLQALSETSV